MPEQFDVEQFFEMYEFLQEVAEELIPRGAYFDGFAIEGDQLEIKYTEFVCGGVETDYEEISVEDFSKMAKDKWELQQFEAKLQETA